MPDENLVAQIDVKISSENAGDQGEQIGRKLKEGIEGQLGQIDFGKALGGGPPSGGGGPGGGGPEDYAERWATSFGKISKAAEEAKPGEKLAQSMEKAHGVISQTTELFNQMAMGGGGMERMTATLAKGTEVASAFAGSLGLMKTSLAGLAISEGIEALGKVSEAIKAPAERAADYIIQMNALKDATGESMKSLVAMQEVFGKAGESGDDFMRMMRNMALAQQNIRGELTRAIEQEADQTAKAHLQVVQAEQGKREAILETQRTRLGVQEALQAQVEAQRTFAGAAIQLQFAPQRQRLTTEEMGLAVRGADMSLDEAQLAWQEEMARGDITEAGYTRRISPQERREFQLRERQLHRQSVWQNLQQAEVRDRRQHLEQREQRAQVAAGLGEVGQAQQAFARAELGVAGAEMGVQAAQLAVGRADIAIQAANLTISGAERAERNLPFEQPGVVAGWIRGGRPEDIQRLRDVGPGTLAAALMQNAQTQFGDLGDFAQIGALLQLQQAGAPSETVTRGIQSLIGRNVSPEVIQRVFGQAREAGGRFGPQEGLRELVQGNRLGDLGQRALAQLNRPEALPRAEDFESAMRRVLGEGRVGDVESFMAPGGARAATGYVGLEASATQAVGGAFTGLITVIGQTASALADLQTAARGGRGRSRDGGGEAEQGGRQHGGLITGPGTDTSDSIRAPWLSNGEYVIKAESVRRIGVPLLDALNEGRLGGFASGGLIQLAQEHGLPYSRDELIAMPDDELMAVLSGHRGLETSLQRRGVGEGFARFPGQVMGVLGDIFAPGWRTISREAGLTAQAVFAPAEALRRIPSLQRDRGLGAAAQIPTSGVPSGAVPSVRAAAAPTTAAPTAAAPGAGATVEVRRGDRTETVAVPHGAPNFGDLGGMAGTVYTFAPGGTHVVGTETRAASSDPTRWAGLDPATMGREFFERPDEPGGTWGEVEAHATQEARRTTGRSRIVEWPYEPGHTDMPLTARRRDDLGNIIREPWEGGSGPHWGGTAPQAAHAVARAAVQHHARYRQHHHAAASDDMWNPNRIQFAEGGYVTGFTPALMSPGEQRSGNGTAGMHVLDLRTDGGTFRASAEGSEIEKIRQSAIAAKITSTGSPSWRT